MAQFNAPFSTASGSTHGPSLVEGTLAITQYAESLIATLPDTYVLAANVALEAHVKDARKSLKHDPEYSGLSEYYDVEGEFVDDVLELEFGFFGVPDNLQGLVSRMEFGDATHPPQAFVRRTVHKKFNDIANDISTTVNTTLGTEGAYA
jgi:hypothetical protein